MSKILHELFLTFFYFGKTKYAPGTSGSLVTVFFWLAVTTIFCGLEIPLFIQNIFWGGFLIITFTYGALSAKIYQKLFKHKNIDHKTIVLDEVIGEIIAIHPGFIVMYNYYFGDINLVVIHLIFCFCVFRFFDITKPSFIGRVDKKFKNGFGVMFDDVLAGIATALSWIILFKLTLLIR